MTSIDEHENTLRIAVNEGCKCSSATNIRLVKLASKASKQQSQKRNSSSEFKLFKGADALIKMLNKKKRTHVCKKGDSIDMSEEKQLIRLFPNPELIAKNKDISTGLTVILDSKFDPPNVKMDKNTSPLTSYLSTCGSRCVKDTSVYSNVGKCENSLSNNYFKRNVCGTVKDLMKDIIVSESNAQNYDATEAEWMTFTSFIKKFSSLPTNSGDNESNVTNEEVEVINETYDESICSTKYELSSYVKTLLNDVVLKKTKKTLSNSLANSDDISSQGSINKTSNQEREINHIMKEQIIKNVSSQDLLSNSSIRINAHRTRSHRKCLKYFIQFMNGKTGCPSETICRCENSNSTSNNNTNKSSTTNDKSKRNPVSLYTYLYENFAERERKTSPAKKLVKYSMVLSEMTNLRDKRRIASLM